MTFWQSFLLVGASGTVLCMILQRLFDIPNMAMKFNNRLCVFGLVGSFLLGSWSQTVIMLAVTAGWFVCIYRIFGEDDTGGR